MFLINAVHRLALALVLCSSLPASAGDASESSSYSVLLNQVERSLQTRRPDPQHPANAFLDGVEHLERDNYDKAVDSFSTVIKWGPNEGLPYLLRGDAYLLWQKPNEAITDYNRAEQRGGLEPQTRLRLHVQRARCLMAIRDYEAGLRDLDAALLIDPRNIAALYWRAEALTRLDRFQEALTAYNARFEAGSVSDESAEHLYSLRGFVHLQLKQFAPAEADLKAALQIKPDDLWNLKRLSYAQEMQGERQEAEEIYRRLAELYPADEWTRRQLNRLKDGRR